MTHKFFFSVTIIFIILFQISCIDLENNYPEQSKETETILYLFPDTIEDFDITRVVENSGINNGGYVVIITDTLKQSLLTANLLRDKFYEEKLIAVHTISINSMKLTNTSKIAIREAKIICILGEFSNINHIMFEGSELGYFLHKAYVQKSSIVLFSPISLYAGYKFIKPNGKIRKGLNLTDFYTTFIGNSKNTNNSEDNNILKLNDTSAALIINKDSIFTLTGKFAITD